MTTALLLKVMVMEWPSSLQGHRFAFDIGGDINPTPQRKKKSSANRPKVGSNHWSIASKRHYSWFTICATGADVSADSAVLLLVLPLPWLTDVSSSQQWVIYSQTNGAVSNYTYLFRFVWFVVVFSDLLFCFRICHCVFWLVIMFLGLLLCFLNCYFVFYICICVCNLLFCFQNCDLFCTSRPPYITPVFSVTWSFRNHSDMQIWWI